MFEYKILFTGPVGAGKTTLVQAFSDKEVVSTEVKPSDDILNMKGTTTVAMDYGNVVLDENTKVHIYGTPGQQRFDFMWEVLSQGSMGLGILINAQSKDPFADLEFYLNAFRKQIVEDHVPVVVAVNRLDINNPHIDINKFSEICEKVKEDIPVLFVDIRKPEDIKKIVMTLLFTV